MLLFILLYKVVITLSLLMKSCGVTIRVELPSTECVPTVTVYTHCKMALPFEPVDAVLKIDLSTETREEGTKFDILSCTSYPGSISCSGTDFKINASTVLVSCPL